MDTELIELCKEVYKRFPDWDWSKTTEKSFNPGTGHAVQFGWMEGSIPLYTSDYLLEKLPRYLRLQRDDMEYPQRFAFKLRASTKDSGNWRAGYYNTPKKQVLANLSIDCHADTPLKALLKLAVALDDAGELK